MASQGRLAEDIRKDGPLMGSANDADIRVMNALRRLVRALRTSGAAASGEMGMSVAQLFALRIIGRQPGLSMGDVAAATLTTPSAVSEVVPRLVARGLVRREPDAEDHRRVLCTLPGKVERCGTAWGRRCRSASSPHSGRWIRNGERRWPTRWITGWPVRDSAAWRRACMARGARAMPESEFRAQSELEGMSLF